ncbi:glycerate kinase [Phycicoccus endophyticus]|uniref:Glycerate kinase n=1 Tax=Phycicoccus endophyticus TaxID=1690220 RepID=A0A7G9R105_9MICO|nr:glycerate kinase [Phycicoccus endophyticus]NHI20597.1 glycerate kinase [Phycicoccus endophyticus]QNN49280.1 glycerate kinase [Phycicoccus endophyticus]GGL44779.1 hypothetical protein GCM10012283_29230 [Phycicoccus endophyticus]
MTLSTGGPVVLALDSFKGALTAQEAARAAAAGWREVFPDADVREVPMADGGEGTARTMVAATGGHWVEVESQDPLGRPVTAGYGVLGPDGSGRLRVALDVATASGLDLLRADERDVWRASSAGTGLLLRHALDAGADEVVLGIGGSATSDGGAGLLGALGVDLLDAAGTPVGPGPAGLGALAVLDATPAHPRLAGTSIRVACDVTNPLTGPEGAAAVYGPQKGATAEDVPRLDAALERLARVAGGDPHTPGAGAAGGIGFALRCVLGAELVSGVELVADTVGLEKACTGARLVITGEGRLDAQTAAGKVPLGVARVAARQGVPTVALVGSLGPGYEGLLDRLAAAWPLAPGPRTLEEALAATADDLRRTARSLAASLAAWVGAG